MGDTNTFSYAISIFFVGVGAVYAVLLVATLLSVLLIPIAFIITPFIIIFLIVSLLTLPSFPSAFIQVLKEFVEKVKEVQWILSPRQN